MGKRKRAGEAAKLRDALLHDTDSAETERMDRKSRKKRKESNRELAGASKQKQQRRKKVGRRADRVKKKRDTKPSEGLAELKGFSEESIKGFMLWQQERGSKQPKKTVDPAADPPPSAPRGRGKYNLPKKKSKKTMPKDEDIDDDKVRGVPRRSISPETMKRHTDTHSRARAHTHTHTHTHTTHTHTG